MIANNLSGTGESHNYSFSGNLPSVPVAATPEPDAIVLFCAILISGSILLRRRRK